MVLWIQTEIYLVLKHSKFLFNCKFDGEDADLEEYESLDGSPLSGSPPTREGAVVPSSPIQANLDAASKELSSDRQVNFYFCSHLESNSAPAINIFNVNVNLDLITRWDGLNINIIIFNNFITTAFIISVTFASLYNCHHFFYFFIDCNIFD